MPRSARALGMDGRNYQGPIIRKGSASFAIFKEPPDEEGGDEAYVVHRWLPYILCWLPVTRHATEAEARARIAALPD
ncbi:MAG: hypothetical protein HY689_08630 [Chloroflexi bacterium]|nr:hypothetical protein [Chloroflexota bacterium]